MAVTALMAVSSSATPSAIANGTPSPFGTAPATSARAKPIETAVTAPTVDKTSAAGVNNSTRGMERLLGAHPRRGARAPARRPRGIFGMSVSSNHPGICWRMPASVRPELGEHFGEAGQIYVLG